MGEAGALASVSLTVARTPKLAGRWRDVTSPQITRESISLVAQILDGMGEDRVV
jgi:hypothetical protein